MSELKVKPCPFCGSDDISFSAFSLSPDAYALCNHCNAGIEIQVAWWDGMTEKEHDEVCNLELQKVWNRRAIDQPQLNENQQIAINNAKKSFEKGADIYDCAIDMMLYDGLTDKEWAKVTVAFLLWVQEQEEE